MIRAGEIIRSMPDGLYERDILSWSEHQANLLRRLARGERVNDLDWAHVVEEIEDVGRSELNAVRGYLRLMLVHLLKIQGWPDHQSADHWRRDIAALQSDALQRYTPSMRQRIDLAAIYARAVTELEDTAFDRQLPRPWSAECPVSPEALLNTARHALEAAFAAPPDRAASAP